MEIKVEIEPHKGVRDTVLGPVEVDLGQYRIFADSGNGRVHVAYKDKREGFGIKFLSTVKLTPEVQEVIKSKVDELTGQVSPPVATSSHIEDENAEE